MSAVRKADTVIAGAVVGIATLLVLTLVVSSAGFSPRSAASAALDGAFGGWFPILSATLKRATPLLFLGTAVAVSFRAGVLNIGAEGQFMVGAAATACAAFLAPRIPSGAVIFVELLAGTIAGAAWAGIAAWLKVRYRATEVVTTLILNFIALDGVGYLVRGPLQEPTHSYPQSSSIGDAAQLPLIFSAQRLHVGFLVAIGVSGLVWWALRATAIGFRIRAVGASSVASMSAGLIDVGRTQALALVVSGAIAGLAGACELTGVTYALFEGLSPGYGYTAIGVALLGGLNPLAIIASATLFGALGAGADAMQRDAQVPAEIAAVATALIILGMLALPVARRAVADLRNHRT